MDDDFDFLPADNSDAREPMYKRRRTAVAIPEEDALLSGDGFDGLDPLDDSSVDIFYLLDQLEELVSVSKRVPFSGRVMVEENEFLALVDQLRIAVPNEVKQAQRVIRERQAIIQESHEEATRILDAARKRADYHEPNGPSLALLKRRCHGDSCFSIYEVNAGAGSHQ